MPETETILYLKRTFKASREEVFNAWTQPGSLQQWFAASHDHVGSKSEVDLRVGGTFRIGMKHVPTGKSHVATGVYEEVRFPDRLVFTWSWEGEPENGQTRITVDLLETNGETEMRFTQEYFPNKRVRDDHEGGWTGCFMKLENFLQARRPVSTHKNR